VNHAVVHRIYERIPKTSKCTVDKRDSESSHRVTEARLEFADAQERCLNAYACLRGITERDEKLQSEIIELVGLINKVNGATDGGRDHEKLVTQATAFELSSFKSSASSINSTSIAGRNDNIVSHTTQMPVLDTGPPVDSPPAPNVPHLMTRVFELSNERLKSCASMETKLLDVKFYGHMRDQTFVALNQLRIKSAKDKTTELRDFAMECMFKNLRQVYLGRKAKRKREDSEGGEDTGPVEGLEYVEIGAVGPAEGTGHVGMVGAGLAEGTELMETEEGGESEDSDDGGVLLATTAETKVEGEGMSKKKRRRKRKKAGMAYMKAVVQSSHSKETRDALEELKAARVLSDVVDVVMPDAGAADDYLVDIDMETFFEPPLPVSPPPTYAERAAKAAATLPPKSYKLEYEREGEGEQEQETDKPKKNKKKRTRLGAAEAYEKSFAKGVKAREEGIKAREEQKLREENFGLGEIEGVDEDGMLIWGAKAVDKPVGGAGEDLPQPRGMEEWDSGLWASVAEERGAWAHDEEL